MNNPNPKCKKTGDFPINAGIKITYPSEGSEPPKIEFTYPDKDRQMKNMKGNTVIFFSSIVLTILTVATIYFFLTIYSHQYYPTSCLISATSANDTNSSNDYDINMSQSRMQNLSRPIIYITNPKYIIFVCTYNNKVKSWIYLWIGNFYMEYWTLYHSDNNFSIPIPKIIGICIIYLILLLIYRQIMVWLFSRTKYGLDKYPKINKAISNKHYEAEFTTCSDNLQIELPLFSNIYLDFEAEEDFSEYLKEFEIKPHDIKYIKHPLFKKKEKTPNIYLWKAVFTFKQKPIKGILRVNFT